MSAGGWRLLFSSHWLCDLLPNAPGAQALMAKPHRRRHKTVGKKAVFDRDMTFRVLFVILILL